MAWYIKGESGRTLDATLRELSALNIDSCTLKFSSLAEDILTWSAATEDATGAGTIVPDIGQVVELYYNSERKFRGHVMAPKVGSKKITIKVVGPWWWMTRITLTSQVTDATAVSAERASYVFSTLSHKTKLEGLIARAIANGVPMLAGTVGEIYDTPKITISEMNCAQALAELLAWVPDGVAWFDYSGASGTDPIFNIGRRGDFSLTSYTLGKDAVIDQDISPRLDLEVAQVSLDYVTRNPTTGLPSWANQLSGIFVAGKKQIITVSGPEISDALPADDFDSYDVQTAATNGAPFISFLFGRDPELIGLSTSGFVEGGGSYFELLVDYIYASGWSTSGGSSGQTTIATTFTDKAGNAVSITGKTLIITDGLPEWVKRELGRTFEEVNIKGDLVYQFLLNNNLGTSFPSPADNPLPDWFSGVTWYRQFDGGQSVGGRQKHLYAFHRYGVSGILVDTTAWSSLTTLYKPWDYDFLIPPPGLALNLKAAQNWVPWEGPITLVADEVSGENLLAAKYNLIGTLAACATMETLARNISHDIFNGRTTIDLGAPARADFGTLTSRVRRQPKDNIVNL